MVIAIIIFELIILMCLANSTGGVVNMWIVISIVLSIFLLILLSSISHKMKTIEALEYMNAYLFKQLVKNNGVEGLEDYENEVERIRKRFKS